ncbi:MAG: hypothetical protein JRI57_04180 [Deltaproteobacteria bacterium]|nr:hypothetical protein [Deltaproteobacteria bacterium]MBW1951648.1 hypothetical protein [Deltaproteobacteria bacterium]MBW1985748.1 hypothetical protein [Deltaproteobacteria bacterium]MBW2134661.1 hypothetical protein [Deltaproteobacteria bacterium]
MDINDYQEILADLFQRAVRLRSLTADDVTSEELDTELPELPDQEEA